MRPVALALLSLLVGCGTARPADTTTTSVTYAAAPTEDPSLAPTSTAPPPPAPIAGALLTLRAGADRASVWRVFADGRATRLSFDFPAVSHESVDGTTAPVASRDGRRIAFVKDAAVSVLDTFTLEVRTLGQRPPAGLDLLVSAWSPDGADLLVHVGSAYHLWSLAAGTASDVPVDGEVRGFFPDGTLAVLSRDGRVLSRATVGSPALTVLYRSSSYMEQLALSADGKSAAFGINIEDVDRVVRVDLSSGAATTVADGSSGRGAQNPWPSFSPATNKLAWLEEPPLVKNEDAVRVALEGGGAVEVGGARISRFHWIDDGTLALESEGRVVVADVESGAIRGRTDIR